MSTALEEKKAIVADINAAAASALSLVAVDYRGIAVQELTDLRLKSRTAGVQVRVVRNTLARRAFEGTEHACLSEVLSGPTLLGFSYEDPGAAARVFKDFAADHELFEIKALSIGGKVLPAAQIDRLANLPTREEALARLMAVMKAPVDKLARTLKDVPGRVTRVLAAIRDQKQQTD